MGKFQGLTGMELFALRSALRVAANSFPPHPIDPFPMPYAELLKEVEQELEDLITQLIEKQKAESDG